MALSITRKDWKTGESYTKYGPEVGEVVRFSAQPYHHGTMEVTSVEIVGASDGPLGERFRVRGRVVSGTVTNRLFGATSTQSIAGHEMDLFCWGPSADGGWDYVYPV